MTMEAKQDQSISRGAIPVRLKGLAGRVVLTLLTFPLVLSFMGCGVTLAPKTEKFIVYEMYRGDTVHGVARAFNVDEQHILEVNQIRDPRRLQVGTRLKVPYIGQPLDRAQYVGKLAAVSGGVGGALPAKPGVTASKAQSTAIGGATIRPVPMTESEPRQELGDAVHYVGKLAWPVVGAPISSNFGYRWFTFHEGMDLAAPEGAPVRAAHSGVVTYSGSGIRGYGNLVVVRGDSLVTVYSHNRSNRARKGQRVSKGEVIAYVGQTGRATGPHLHYETRVRSKDGRNVAVDPLTFYP